MDKPRPNALIGIILLLGVFAIAVSTVPAGDNDTGPVNQFGNDPLNATYLIEGHAFHLSQGQSAKAAAPSSATRIKTTVLGKPVYGDLTGDGNKGAAVLLAHDPGGSGTFYYVAVALEVNHRYQGTNAVLIGDRIVPRNIVIGNGAVKINYLERLPEEPLSAAPSVLRTSILILNNDRLEAVTPQYSSEKLLEGWVTIGHEVRSFQPCERQQALWLMGDAPALKEIINAYRQALPQAAPYQKLLMLLGGELVAPPAKGFGAEYEAGFIASRLVRVAPDGQCMAPGTILNSPVKANQKITFDLDRLDPYGLLGTGKAKHALSYEFCIPDTTQCRAEVQSLDPTLQVMPGSPGRIGCKDNESLCVGSTFQPNFKEVLQRLADLTYIQKINERFFE